MKTTFIQIALTFAILIASLLSSCNSNALINKDDITVDSLNYIVFKTTGEKVTGRVESKVLSEKGDSILSKALFKNGLIKEDKSYLAGRLVEECYYHPHAINVVSKREEFDENGKLCQIDEWNEKGIMQKTTLYYPNGQIKRLCEFDES